MPGLAAAGSKGRVGSSENAGDSTKAAARSQSTKCVAKDSAMSGDTRRLSVIDAELQRDQLLAERCAAMGQVSGYRAFACRAKMRGSGRWIAPREEGLQQ